jgi:hypothetical protein
VAARDPGDRRTIARIGGLTRAARHDGRQMTERARRAGPGSIDYWIPKVDPDGNLDRDDAERRATAARSAHFIRLGRKSGQARRAGAV